MISWDWLYFQGFDFLICESLSRLKDLWCSERTDADHSDTLLKGKDWMKITSGTRETSGWSSPNLCWYLGLSLPRRRTLHLPLLHFILFLSAQLSRLSGSPWMAEEPSGVSATPPVLYHQQPCPIPLSRSSINKLNKMGPSIDPWGKHWLQTSHGILLPWSQPSELWSWPSDLWSWPSELCH